MNFLSGTFTKIEHFLGYTVNKFKVIEIIQYIIFDPNIIQLEINN